MSARAWAAVRIRRDRGMRTAINVALIALAGYGGEAGVTAADCATGPWPRTTPIGKHEIP